MAGFGPPQFSFPTIASRSSRLMRRFFTPIAAILLAIVLSMAADPAQAGLFRNALTAFQRGDLPAAEQALRTELKSRPGNAAALGLLCIVLDSEKNYTEAGDCYRRALAAAPRSITFLNNFGNHLLATRDAKGARKAFLEVLALDPQHENANLELAKLAIDDKQAGEALRSLDRLPPDVRESPPVVLLRLQGLYLAGRKADAEAILFRFSQSAGSDARLDFSAGLALAAVEQFDQAEVFFSRALESAGADFDVLYNLGLAAFHAGHQARAQNVLGIALSQRPQDVDVLYNLAAVDVALKQNDAALALLAQASRLAPDHLAVQQLLARSAMDLSYYADAVLAWNKCVALAPQDDAARRERGFAMALSGQPAKGIIDLRWYVQRHPDDAVGFYELGAAETKVDKDKALLHLDRAISLQPDFLPARFSRAVLYGEMAKPESALPDLQFALAREPDSPNLLDRLGRTYADLDRPQDAVPLLRKATALAPGNLKILFHLSRALAGAGQSAESRAVIEQYRRLGPERRPRNPPAGMVEFLSLSPEEQDAQFRARLQKRLGSDPDNAIWRLEQLRLLLSDGKMSEGATAARQFLALQPAASLLSNAGHALLEAEQYPLAKEVLEQASAGDPSPEVRLDLAIATFHAVSPKAALDQMEHIAEAQRSGDYYLARANMLDAAGSTDSAASDLNRALRAAPQRASLYRDAARFLLRHKRIPAALQLVEQASRILPDSPSILLLEASTLEVAQKTDEAQRLLSQIESRWPEWSDPYVTFGIVLATHRRYEEARRQLETALSLGADGPAVWYYLAESTYHLSPDEIDSARKQVERALEFETDNPWAHALAGRIAFEQEQYEKAVAQLREAVRLRPSLLQAHYDLAKAYAILGRKEDAQAETEQVRLIRERYPSGEEDAAIAPNPLLPGQAQ